MFTLLYIGFCTPPPKRWLSVVTLDSWEIGDMENLREKYMFALLLFFVTINFTQRAGYFLSIF